MRKRGQKRLELQDGADSPLNHAISLRDRSVIDMVTDAVRHKHCMLAYQRVVKSQDPEQVVFFEGLIRVLDATERVIPAREFMSAVEDREIGRELDCIALEKGLRALERVPDLRLSVNMSARSIGYRRWSRILHRFLARDASIGERLLLEISQTSAMSVPELVMDFMIDLRRHGVAFALDDFGAGPISLPNLGEFFFDAAKIDGQFIRDVDTSPDKQTLVRTMIQIARQFDMMVIAEAVETRQEAEFLNTCGVDCLQGYLFEAPKLRPNWGHVAKQAESA